MSTSVYTINKGINKPIEFKGLKAQYIWWLAAGILVLLIVFATLYISGVNTFVSLGIIALLGTALFMRVYAISRKYGEHGMIKAIARRSVPRVVKVSSRNTFTKLNHQ